jgi:hypothetical protein
MVLLAAALVWGNCAGCTEFIAAQPESHDCCDKDQAPKPAPTDCAGQLVDFTKATQPDPSKAPVILAESASVAQIAIGAASDTDTRAAGPALLTSRPLVSKLPLRI